MRSFLQTVIWNVRNPQIMKLRLRRWEQLWEKTIFSVNQKLKKTPEILKVCLLIWSWTQMFPIINLDRNMPCSKLPYCIFKFKMTWTHFLQMFVEIISVLYKSTHPPKKKKKVSRETRTAMWRESSMKTRQSWPSLEATSMTQGYRRHPWSRSRSRSSKKDHMRITWTKIPELFGQIFCKNSTGNKGK